MHSLQPQTNPNKVSEMHLFIATILLNSLQCHLLLASSLSHNISQRLNSDKNLALSCMHRVDGIVYI